jgi:hypothetical protein
MRLTTKQIERTESQIGGQALPDDHPAVSQLTKIYGDHTFFVDQEGLGIVETPDRERMDSAAAKVVKLCSWADPDHTALAAHEPQSTDVVVDLGWKDS